MIKLFEIFNDGMVLQRDKEVSVWGWSDPLSQIVLIFKDKKYETKTNNQGCWTIILSPCPFGGPYEMTVTDGKSTIKLTDILIGDVYLASGQSNMEIPIRRTLDRLNEIVKNINNPFIREFRVPIVYNFDKPQTRLTGGSWKNATGTNIVYLGAVSYFFAAAIYEKLGVPIGIVNTGVGGSPIEAWLSEEAIHGTGEYDTILCECKDASHVQNVLLTEKIREQKWYEKLNTEDKGLYGDRWTNISIDESDWLSVNLPFYFRDKPPLLNFQGSIWFRKEIIIPEGTNLNDVTLFLGAIIDADETFINEQLVGKTEYMYPPRRYSIPDGVLHHGTNQITVRLIVNRNSGGFVDGKKYCLSGSDWKIELNNEWKYNIGAVLSELPQSTFFQNKPCGLFNAMLSPLAPFSYRGILWYQGESNGYNSDKYEDRMATLIFEWRNKMDDNLPFLYVQLPNFNDPTQRVPETVWPFIREAQRKTLKQKNTAMVVSIDVGEANDLHPQDKKTIGDRLALCARSLIYGENIEFSGPCCEFATFNKTDGKVVLKFSHISGGLKLRNSPSSYFELCGSDGKYHYAKAFVRDDCIVIQCHNGENPTSLRYAWLNNPENPDLYNNSDLPASPFEITITT